jgi:hypothetical protein
MAQACGRQVEDISARTEDSQTFANPNGTYELREYLVPQWAKSGDGAWAPVDTTLRLRDGKVVPGNTTMPMWFSAGGDGGLATLVKDSKELSMSWPKSLPAPVLEASSATYPEVLPDVDLRVTAEPSGFSQVLVVKSRRGAAQAALDKVRFNYTAKGVELAALAGGGVEARDDRGQVVFKSPPPTMWDSRGASPDSAGAQGLPRVATMAEEVGAAHLAVVPDRAMLSDPGTEYPVFIDPSWSGGIQNNVWKIVASRPDVANSSTFTLNNGATRGDAGAGKTCDATVTSSGSCPTTYGYYLIRTMFEMQTSGVVGKHVLQATFNINQKWSSTCNPQSNARLWLTGGINGSTSWNTQPNWVSEYIADAPANHRVDGGASCAGEGNVAFNVTHIVNLALQQGWFGVTVGLRAIDEGTMNHWKRFDHGTASMSIVYNSYPYTPDTIGVQGQSGCADEASRPLAAVATPSLSARITDPDGANEGDINGWLQGEFDLYRRDPSLGLQYLYRMTGTTQVGGTTTVNPSPGLANGVYAFSARAVNNWSFGGSSGTDGSAWIGFCYFEVDAVRPNTATITPDAVNSPFVTGKTVRLALSPGGTPADTDITGYNWWVVDGAGTSAVKWAPGATATIDWTPIAGQGTIHIQAKDRIQTSAATATYAFNAAQSATELGRWPLNDPAGSTSATDISGNGHNAAVLVNSAATLGAPGRVVNGPTVLSAPPGSLGEATVTGTSLDTSKSYTVAAWVKLKENTWNRSAVAMDGNRSMAMTLGVDYFAGKFRMLVCPVDMDNPTCWAAFSTRAPQLNTWTHLAGTFDSASGTVRLYVNGVPEGSVTFTGPAFTATGPLSIGRLRWNGGFSDRWPGSLADVRVWNRTLAAADIKELADPTSPDNIDTDMVGRWLVEPENCVGTPAVLCQDTSLYAHDLNLNSGITTTPAGHTGAGLVAQGVDVSAETTDPNTGLPGPVLNTDQSFTVSAWVRIDDADPSDPDPDLPTNNRTVLGQTGTKVSGFYLGIRHTTDGPHWGFAIPEADIDAGENPGTPARWYDIYSSALLTVSDIGVWKHLVATYDANTHAMRLYVNGVEMGSGTRDNESFTTTGPFTIGSAWWTPPGGVPQRVDDWRGGIDTVFAFQGVVPASSVNRIP